MQASFIDFLLSDTTSFATNLQHKLLRVRLPQHVHSDRFYLGKQHPMPELLP